MLTKILHSRFKNHVNEIMNRTNKEKQQPLPLLEPEDLFVKVNDNLEITSNQLTTICPNKRISLVR